MQVRSLTNRKRYTEAIELAVDALGELGWTVPAPEQLPEMLERYFEYLYRWLDHTDETDDLARPEITDPTLLAVTCLFNAVFPTATFAGDTFMQAWLSLEAVRIRLVHGIARGMVAPASYSAVAAIALRDDYGRLSGVPPDHRGGSGPRLRARDLTGAVRVAHFSPWFEPLEISAQQAKRAHEP